MLLYIFLIYVDYLIITINYETINKFIDSLTETFSIKSLGDFHYFLKLFLGIRDTSEANTSTLMIYLVKYL